MSESKVPVTLRLIDGTEMKTTGLAVPGAPHFLITMEPDPNCRTLSDRPIVTHRSTGYAASKPLRNMAEAFLLAVQLENLPLNWNASLNEIIEAIGYLDPATIAPFRHLLHHAEGNQR